MMPARFNALLIFLLTLPVIVSCVAPKEISTPRQAFAAISVVNESGKVLNDASVTLLARHGNNVNPLDFHVTLRISADGYYSSVQSFSRAELSESIAPVRLVKRQPGRTLLAFAGDVMLGRRYYQPNPGEPAYVKPDNKQADSDALLSIIAPYFGPVDIASVNLETPIFTADRYQKADKFITFFAHPSLLQSLSSSGIDYAALGNNHSYDYLQAGLAETLEHLDHSGLAYSGAGLDEVSALAPAIMRAGTTRLAMTSMVGWPGKVSPNQVAEGTSKGGAALGNTKNIQDTLSAVDDSALSVFQFHGGQEYNHQPPADVRERLQQAIAAGADLIIGHHPHVLQGFELHNDRLIAYSLGNFLFDQYIYDTHQSGLLYVWMDGNRFYRAELVPLYIKAYRPTPATDAFRSLITRRLRTLSAGKGLHFTDSGGHLQMQAATRAQDSGETLDGANLWPAGDFQQHGAFGLPEIQWQYKDQPGSQPLLYHENNTVLMLDKPVHQRYFSRTWYTQALSVHVAARAIEPGTITFCLELRDRQMSIAEARNNPERHCQQKSIQLAKQWTDLQFTFTLPPNADYRGYRLAFNSNVELHLDNIRLQFAENGQQ